MCICSRPFSLWGPLLVTAVLVCVALSCKPNDTGASLALDVNWKEFSKTEPGGMTLWLYKADGSYGVIRKTTSSVRHVEFYMNDGVYNGLLCNYSPDEFANVAFVDMDYYAKAAVELFPMEPAETDLDILGPDCFGGGVCETVNPPEPVASATFSNMELSAGRQTGVEVTPRTLVQQLEIRIPVKGTLYIYEVKGSVAGLARGVSLNTSRMSDIPCVMLLDGWQLEQTAENEGFLITHIATFGPRNRQGAADVRLNLKFFLRDRETVLTYHLDVGDRVAANASAPGFQISLDDSFPGLPDLPYVEAKGGAGFGADVDPWDNTNPPVNVDM